MMNRIYRLNFSGIILLNFVVLAAFGALLRYMLCFPTSLNYLNILHAHSHFAFAGWVFMALIFLLAKQIGLDRSIAMKEMLVLTLLSSLGMLISFSMQGYKAVSIVLSTLFLLLTFQFAYVASRHLIGQNSVYKKLFKASLFFLVISSIGPLALGALKASGNTGIVYQNSIYFYLHFQMNGWMLFAVLALLSHQLDLSKAKISLWLNLFIASTVLLFFIFTLWAKPPVWVAVLATLGALLNAVSWFMLVFKLGNIRQKLSLLLKAALLAISIKVVFQLFVCVPQIGEWTFANRNLIIGYVHLLTLGCVTPVIIQQFIEEGFLSAGKMINRYYIGLTGLYLALLFVQPGLALLGLNFAHYQYCLLLVSFLYCIVGCRYFQHLHQPQVLLTSNKHLNQFV
jgi:hypothetical protein